MDDETLFRLVEDVHQHDDWLTLTLFVDEQTSWSRRIQQGDVVQFGNALKSLTADYLTWLVMNDFI